MAKNKQPKEDRKIIEEVIDCDIGRMFDDLPDVIIYLQEVIEAHPGKKLVFDEHWTGYEDNEFRFIYHRPETDEEVAKRHEQEEEKRRRAQVEKDRERARQQKVDQFNKLKRELGY